MGRLGRGGAKKSMLAMTIKDKAVLFSMYMPFVKNGGLFLSNKVEYTLGEEVFILLNLMDETEKIPLAGKVIWVAKKGVKSPHTAGVGIQFTDPDNLAKDKIETYLAGSLNSTNSTHTM
ncbi:MAG: PilZ domain-containing protein [Pseudomonadales bacterium]|jgi:type IV pilus assembly protein PilZ|nr:PilZ domain-containing protein [Pseudomonadales bacterium]MDP7358485.1 PilZ domain-containing protein [Pseudomonadales bacterium]MDP7594928.1 PilZ domain-containing protein [Pseudomonadales bacterium]HJN50008.1 PilZ domain-containing protein [Pseudomonadales bacterium]|tara:strand:+ start:360 stop:716 length:357 start_codon:yes stop_codon:yes gene_type:complete